jgi:uncharacterized MAPEG superfamily protein
MQFALWMVLIAALLPYGAVGAAKFTRSYDNAAPRAFLARLTGWRARATAAQQNHFEAFPPFAAGVAFAQMAHAPEGMTDRLAGLFIALRLAYTAAYIAGLATVRTALFAGGIGCVIGLFVLAA